MALIFYIQLRPQLYYRFYKNFFPFFSRSTSKNIKKLRPLKMPKRSYGIRNAPPCFEL